MKRRKNLDMVLAVCVFLAALATPAGAVTYYVDPNGSADFNTIQEAIDAAGDDDEIEVAPGTYNEAINLSGKAITLRSTEANDPNVVARTIIDANGLASPVVTCNSGEGPNTILAGFTITGGSATNGGGMYNEGGSPTVTNCTFSGNSMTYPWGHGGGGMRNKDSSPMVTNCTFSNNTAIANGGGMYNFGSSPTVTNCNFTNNSVTVGGGGMANDGYSSPTVTNCTFSNNTALGGGGMYNNWYSSPTVTNCILWGDTPDEIVDAMSSSTTVSYSDVEDGWLGAGGNNIDADPMFVDGAAGDLRLSSSASPCVDGGDNKAPNLPATDLAGNPRVVDGDRNGAAIVDMGAYEFQSRPIHNITQDRWYEIIQAAIDDANDADEIEVGAGTYNEAINFNGKAITLRSSNPNDPNIVAATVIDGTGYYHVVQCVTGEGPNTVLSGFTITGGNANGGSHPHWHGGGMLNDHSSPTVKNCALSGNTASYDGGGMFNWDNSSPTVTDCNFRSNSAQRYGGGMADYNSSPTVTECNFTGNSADYDGGGMFNWDNSNPMVTDCNFSGNSAQRYGGGMANYSSSPTVTNCNFSGNSATSVGGGMYNYASSPTVTDCNFSGNSTTSVGGGMYNYEYSSPTVTNCVFMYNFALAGGGMYNSWYSSPEVTNCTFSGNSTDSAGAGMYNYAYSDPNVTNCAFSDNHASLNAGGMRNNGYSSPTVTNCTFSGNIADANGGGMSNRDNSNPTVTDCNFSNNIAELGGGMDNEYSSSPTVTNCTFSGNSAVFGGGMDNEYSSSPTVTNCTFSGNSAVFGGGMENYSFSSPTVTNCTFSGNSADVFGGGGMDNWESSSPTVTNCILWGDTPDEIYDDFASSTTVNYSDIQGGWWGAGGYNIDADPYFVDAGGGNLRLALGSPCIDAADNSGVPADMADLDGDGNTVEPTPLDLNGFPRFIDDLCTGDSGYGTPPIVDMGANEFLRSDIDSSGGVNFKDHCAVAQYWLETGCGFCGGADVTCDGDIDWNDLSELLDWWLAGK